MGNLLILLCESPFHHESVDHALDLAEAALKKDHQVNLFLMMDGVYNPVTSQDGGPFKIPSVSERISKLIGKGLKVSGCRVCMELRGVKEEMLPEGVEVGGIFDLDEALEEADVVLSFTGVH